MIKTKENQGVTLVSLIITIVLILIISSTAIYTSYERFELNKFKKLINDLKLLSDKVSNYYLKYNALPVVRDVNNEQIEYKYTSLDFEKNENDNETSYYILDLQAMEGISLNYGKEGFENLNASEDVYIINEASHTIYYVKGIKLNEKTYHTFQNDENIVDDKIPPTKPEIRVISGTKNNEGIYITEVEIEIVPGKDNWSEINKTAYSINGEEFILTSENSIYEIDVNGTYQINVISYDKNENFSENSMQIVIKQPNIGQYVNYDVSYKDMYSLITYDNSLEGRYGWRYLGKEKETGNHLLISTGIPMILRYHYQASGTNDGSSKWWDADETKNANVRMVNGLLNNMEYIPYTKVAEGTVVVPITNTNTMIGLFDGNTKESEDGTYTAVGNQFLSDTYSSKVRKIRTLTLGEINRALNRVNGNNNLAENSTPAGFKDLTGDALGLFDMNDLEDYNASHSYWLASPRQEDTTRVLFVQVNGVSFHDQYWPRCASSSCAFFGSSIVRYK